MVCSYHHSFLVCLVLAVPVIQGLEYTVTNNAQLSWGGQVFEEIIGADRAERSMEAAVFFVQHRVFEQTTESDKKQVEKIRLIIQPRIDEGTALYVQDKEVHEIHISAEYFKRYVPKNYRSMEFIQKHGDIEERVRHHFHWMITFGVSHALQWTANGEIPQLLRSSIAAVAILQAHYKPYFWAEAGEGSKWDESFDIMAQFFYYINKKKEHFVAELNKKMRTSYDESYIEEAMGMPIAEWWKLYKDDNPRA